MRSALIGLTAAVADRAELAIKRDIDVALPALSPETELVVYRIAQESLTNVVRHAGARHVEVALGVRDGVLELRVADDGEGLNGADLHAGRGISGMRERAAYTGATLDVSSRPVGGTEVKLRVPLA